MTRPRSAGGPRVELDAKRSDDCTRYVVLNTEDIAHLALIAVAPSHKTVAGAGELSAHAQTVACSANGSFENRTDVERASHFACVDPLTLEGERRAAGCH